MTPKSSMMEREVNSGPFAPSKSCVIAGLDGRQLREAIQSKNDFTPRWHCSSFRGHHNDSAGISKRNQGTGEKALEGGAIECERRAARTRLTSTPTFRDGAAQ
jgi:hypothetical protein